MNTWSHFLVNAALNRPIKKKQSPSPTSKLPQMRSSAFMLGSVLPDLMLVFMGIAAIIYDMVVGNIELSRLFSGPEGGGEGPSEAMLNSVTGKLFETWFFENPIVITLHHLFGSPLLLALYIAIGYWLWRKGKGYGGWIFWLAVGCMIHTTADVFLHTNDGPLLLFPLNWEWRFESPVSYWDRDHHGAAWSWFENRLDIALIIWLIGSWIWRKFSKKTTAVT